MMSSRIQSNQLLKVKRLGIDTYQESIIYMRADCPVCRAEGFEAEARVRVFLGDTSIMATLNVINNGLLAPNEVGLSEIAIKLLKAKEGDLLRVSHPEPLESLSLVRAKVHGKKLSSRDYQQIIHDVASGSYSDVHLSSFITACASSGLDLDEMVSLTQAMVAEGDQLSWPSSLVMDKHCVGGLPGNRTTLIVVPIITAFGLTMPKTSSRAITSPAGTADVMETITQVDLGLNQMRHVVDLEGGCIVWGGAVRLSPADDVLIRVERPLDLDSQGQLVASILSKKKAAGSTHVIIDMPVGSTAKVRNPETAQKLSFDLIEVGRRLGLSVRILITDGEQPVGIGVGPVLEARDALAVLRNDTAAPLDLKDRALSLAAALLEFSEKVPKGQGRLVAEEILRSGAAYKKFQAICEAQGGFREPQEASYSHIIESKKKGTITRIDNRRLARIGKLAGAPKAPAAGLKVHVRLEEDVQKGQPLFTLYAETPGELTYALNYVETHPDIYQISEE